MEPNIYFSSNFLWIPWYIIVKSIDSLEAWRKSLKCFLMYPWNFLFQYFEEFFEKMLYESHRFNSWSNQCDMVKINFIMTSDGNPNKPLKKLLVKFFKANYCKSQWKLWFDVISVFILEGKWSSCSSWEILRCFSEQTFWFVAFHQEFS